MNHSIFVVSCTFAVALAAAPLTAQRLISVHSQQGVADVYELDPNTAARTLIGSMSPTAAVPAALAYDQNTGRLFMSGASTDSLYVVDVTNWQGHLVGSYGNAAVLMHGMEWDSSTNTLYAMSSHNAGLYTVDTTTGLATLVGTSGLPAALSYGFNLCYDLMHDVMFLTSTSTDSLYTIDRTTGLATLVGPMTGTTNISSLAYRVSTLTMYGIDNLQDVLYRIDTTTGAATAIGSVGSTNMIGLVWLEGAGRLAREAHACGPTTITPMGEPSPGFTTTFTLGGTTGFPLIGFGFQNLPQVYCGCTIGHEWLGVAAGTSAAITLPGGPAFIGLTIRVQGADLFGSGGCASPQFTVSDTIRLTIG